MESLKKKFAEKALALFTELRAINKEHGDLKVGDVTLGQVTGGARGIKMMLWETSQLDANEGIRFRGFSIPEVKKLLPSGPQGEPKPEGLFWLMLTGDVPTEAEVNELTAEWHRRADVPAQVFKTLDSMPADVHPMTQFTIAIMAMQPDSIFARRYGEGMAKTDHWDAVYEDSMNLIARLPHVAAYIYRRAFKDGEHIAPDTSLDWSANFAHMLGSDEEDFRSLMRLYLTIHADHEGGNASAHTVSLVSSTLSDPYRSLAAGMNALAGPLHGLANQEVIKWIFEMIEKLGTKTPSKDQIRQYVQETLDARKVIPGYGHAVLREPDPRFTAQRKFAEQYIKDSDLIDTVWKIFDVVPPMLEALGKVKNPWPNVDAHSGALLVHYGFSEYSYYTVLFGVSRGLGVLAAGIWSRALGQPLERPKSVTSDWIKSQINAK
ncbi:MAG: citrate synthase [Neolewinella sp.]|jgi:citrate synthase